ncbi:CMGC/SRPK protein kinase [Hygrophoropsis aurantiaca]|uniref:CMGC/SRPK protein kinase n=1 Tax=Hygrophoropsis aurantiaca TaxID=72124 RepID=A0ACB8AST2_9AGAM|nr:CMGC/SRPK protein kinase [Hygrophoropsis aurantiaca]
MAAYMSGRELNVTPELVVPQKLGHPAQHNVQLIKDHFMEKGPNGMHLCLVSQFEGPSVLSMYEFLGMSFKTRIRSELARKVAKQAATVIERMHAAGFVHGDITTSNLLFKISDDAQRWSDREVYTMLGQPVTEVVVTRNGGPPEPCAPRELVEAVDVSCLMLSSLLQESIVVTDFGQSFSVDRIPKDYVPATVLYCTPPEVFFDSEISFASDVWMLACTIFGTRAGYSLFDSLLHSDEIIWMQIVETLGKLPEPWWSAFAPRKQWFEDNGEPKPEDVQKREGALLIAAKSSIREKLRQIGEEEGPPGRGDSWISEATCTKLDEAEVELLGDLLEKMLRYRPEDRVTMREVIEHPWFQY